MINPFSLVNISASITELNEAASVGSKLQNPNEQLGVITLMSATVTTLLQQLNDQNAALLQFIANTENPYSE